VVSRSGAQFTANHKAIFNLESVVKNSYRRFTENLRYIIRDVVSVETSRSQDGLEMY